MLSRILAWVLLCVGLFAADSSPGFAQQSKPHPVKQVARVVTCSFVPLTAKSMGIPLCPGTAPDLEQVADTIPGTAGVPSSQVITVQGCTGCISTGSGGGGGGGASYSGVPANAYGQTGTANSFTGIAGFDYATSGVDALTVAPFGGNGSGTGYPAAYGQPGVLVVQGGLQGGAIAISGNLGGPYSAATAQPTTPASFMGVGGTDGTNFRPLSVNSSGQQVVVFPSAQPVALPTTQPVQIQNGANTLAVDANGVTNTKVCDATTSTNCAYIDTNGAPRTRIIGASGTTAANVEAIGDGQGSQNSLTVIPYEQAFNGSTWDRKGYCTSTYTTGTSPITSATTTAVVAVSGSTKVHVCDWQVQTVSGTSPTFYFETGTGTACATPTGTLSAQLTGAALSVFSNAPNSTNYIMTGAASSGLCIVTGGTSTPTFAVTLHYAQY